MFLNFRVMLGSHLTVLFCITSCDFIVNKLAKDRTLHDEVLTNKLAILGFLLNIIIIAIALMIITLFESQSF